MIIGALKENKKDENRVALTPESAQLLAKLGHKCLIAVSYTHLTLPTIYSV